MRTARAIASLAMLWLLLDPFGAVSQISPGCPLKGERIVTQLRISGDLALLASYQAQQADENIQATRWTGDLQAVFVDAQGWLREDGDGDARLGDYASDPAIGLEYDETGIATRLRRYQGDPQLQLYNTLPLHALRPLWSAASKLSEIADTSLQRDYASAGSGRHLLSAIDLDLDGRLDAREQLPFTIASFAEGRYGLLDASSLDAATNLLEQLRAQHLGMIVNSRPLLVGAPAENYDLLYADRSYADFLKRYRQRRNVIYVGAQDGMLHAFNAGFADNANHAMLRSPPGGSASAQALGAELWAYLPYNLLPHLRELAANGAPRNAIVDAAPTAFDARIFSDDADHPGGWGTVLMVGMRLGGAAMLLSRSAAPAAFSGFTSSSDTISTRPALLLLDVSNPEVPPQLLAELTDAQLGHTVSQAAVARIAGKWFLLFGSGPEDIVTGSVSGKAKLYVYDLAARRYAAGYAPRELGSEARSYVGSAVSVDWNLDFNTDSVYFGTVSSDAGAPGGKLYRLSFNDSADAASWSLQMVLDIGRPLPGKPVPRLDARQRRWIYVASGRLLVDGDAYTRTTQGVTGIIDSGDTSIRVTQLFDASSARLNRASQLNGLAGMSRYAQLLAAVDSSKGWRVDWRNSGERAIGDPALEARTLLVNTAVPQSSCLSLQRRLYALDADSGALRVDTGSSGFTSTTSAAPALGAAPPAAISLHPHVDADGKPGVVVLAPNTAAAVETPLPAGAALPASGEIDWWELHP